MKTNSFYLLFVATGAALFALAAPQPISGQNSPQPAATAVRVEASADFPPQVVALIDELTTQNKQLAANQTAMDAKIDEVAEAVRQARLFSSRAGKGAAK